MSLRASTVNFSLRLCLSGVFFVAGVMKLLDIASFAQRVGEFGIVLDSTVELTAWIVVVAELLIAVALVLGLRGGLVSAVGILLMFSGVMIYGMIQGLDIDCGCFGPEFQITLKTQLFVDFGLLLLCGMIYATSQRGTDRNNPTSKE